MSEIIETYIINIFITMVTKGDNYIINDFITIATKGDNTLNYHKKLN